MTHGIITSISATTALTTDTTQTVTGDKTFTGTIAVPTQSSSDNSTKAASTAFVQTAVGNVDALPSQTGQNGKFLTTNGTAASWATVDLSSKQDTITGAATSITSSDLTASKALVSDSSGKVDVSSVTATELGYLSGVTSSVQTQLGNKADAATTLAGYGITDAYTKTELDGKISSVYKYKGTVANYASLPSTGLTEGDVYNVADTGDNYAWVAPHNETAGFWDKLAGNIDLSSYRTSTDQDTLDALKAPLSSPTFTGTPAAPTAAAGTNTTQIATTAFVKTATDGVLPSQTSQSGKMLTTNGTSVSWSTPVTVTLRNWNATTQE